MNCPHLSPTICRECAKQELDELRFQLARKCRQVNQVLFAARHFWRERDRLSKLYRWCGTASLRFQLLVEKLEGEIEELRKERDEWRRRAEKRREDND